MYMNIYNIYLCIQADMFCTYNVSLSLSLAPFHASMYVYACVFIVCVFIRGRGGQSPKLAILMNEID